MSKDLWCPVCGHAVMQGDEPMRCTHPDAHMLVYSVYGVLVPKPADWKAQQEPSTEEKTPPPPDTKGNKK